MAVEVSVLRYHSQAPEHDREPHWSEKGSCAGMSLDLFFDPYRMAEAVNVCETCPVRAKCLEENKHEEYGVFGGMTPLQRARKYGRKTRDFHADEPVGTTVTSLPEEEVNEIIRLYTEENLGLRLVAKAVGRNKSTVHRVIHGAGLTRSPEAQAALIGPNRASVKNIPGDATFKARQALLNGEKVLDVAAKLNLHKDYVYKLRGSMVKKGILQPLQVENNITFDVDLLHKYRQEGYSWEEIVGKVGNGATHTTIRRYYKAHHPDPILSVPVKAKKDKLTMEEVHRRRGEGEGWAAIAKDSVLAMDALRTRYDRWLKETGTPRNTTRRKQCYAGHAMTEANTYRRKSGATECRICRSENNKRWNASKQA